MKATKPSAVAAGVHLELHQSAQARVLGAYDELVSAVANLVLNAIKYSGSSRVVDISVSTDRGSCRIDVTDYGIGIPPQDQERIFERFYRVDRSRDRTTGGSGLGLAIVRHVAANHGGFVSVISREGEGSTFSLSLPLAVEV